MSINRTQKTVRSHYTYLRNTRSIWDHETKTYQTDTSISWGQGRDQDQLLCTPRPESGLETTLVSRT